jgi:hypothetical protein
MLGLGTDTQGEDSHLEEEEEDLLGAPQRPQRALGRHPEVPSSGPRYRFIQSRIDSDRYGQDSYLEEEEEDLFGAPQRPQRALGRHPEVPLHAPRPQRSE